MYLLLKIFSTVLGAIPEKFIVRLCRFLSILSFDVLRVRRNLILKNLGIAFGSELERDKLILIGRESVFNFFQTVFEFLRAPAHDIAGSIKMHGREHIEKALEKNQGTFIVCMHMGNWEALACGVSRQLGPVHVTVKDVGSAGVDRFVNQIRRENGFLSIKKSQKGAAYREIRKALKKNHIVGFIMDQARPGAPKIDFFGHPAKTNTSLATIYQKTNTPIVTGYILRREFGRHEAYFGKELELPVTGDTEEDTLAITKTFNRALENVIKKHPDQYFWMHNRWKT